MSSPRPASGLRRGWTRLMTGNIGSPRPYRVRRVGSPPIFCLKKNPRPRRRSRPRLCRRLAAHDTSAREVWMPGTCSHLLEVRPLHRTDLDDFLFFWSTLFRIMDSQAVFFLLSFNHSSRTSTPIPPTNFNPPLKLCSSLNRFHLLSHILAPFTCTSGT